MKGITFKPAGVLLTLLLALCGKAGFSQETLLNPEYSYRRFTQFDGLPSKGGINILQDKKGFIWVADIYGFIRFDGFSFTNYMDGKDANLYRLDRDENGNIRAFTRNLMYTFDENHRLVETKLSEDKYLSQNASFALPDGYGIYTQATAQKQQALYKISGDRFEKVLEHPYLEVFPETTHTFFDVEKQELYLFYDHDTVRVIADKKEITTYTGITARAACKYNNTLYILANDGIYRLTDRKLIPLIKADLRVNVMPVKIIADKQGALYFNRDNVLYRFNGEAITPVFHANMIMDFIFDNESNLWVVTYQGLYNLFGMEFQHYRLSDENDVVRMVIYHPEKEAVIAGTLNGKIIEIGRNGINEIPYPANPYHASFFYDYSAFHDGALYLPGPGDILMLKAKEKRWLNLPFFASPLFVVTLPNGNMLQGKAERLIEFSKTGTLIKDYDEYAMQQAVYAKPCHDVAGRLWFGGGKGITIYDYAGQKIVKTIFNDSVKLVRFMNNDREGNVWFSSENRLFRSSGDTVRLEMTLPHLIRGIYFTKLNNRLIVTSLNGFYLFDVNRRNYRFYNHENGYMGGEPSSGSMAEDSEGNIWLPSMTGLFRFHPEKLISSPYKPKLQMVSMLSSTNNIHWNPLSAKLNFRHNHIRFGYIGLSYTAAQNVRYHYRLIGFQNDWSEPVKQREVTFNNLPPGSYVFEIYADAGTDESRSEALSYAFSITPAFWQTAWFMTACIAFLLLSGAGVGLVIQQRKNKKLWEKLRAEKELNELRISSIRLKAIPHFNANILAAIEYYITNRSREDVIRILDIYSDFTYKTLSEVDKASRPLSEELAYVKMYLDLEKIRFIEKFDFQIKVDSDVNESVHLPNMILHTYCENAVKHGLMPLTSGGLLTIHVSQQGQTVCVSVEDNGVGRAYAAQNPHLHSTKQGLSILNRQIEIYNRFNREKINRRTDDLSPGTRFTVEVPLGFSYMN